MVAAIVLNADFKLINFDIIAVFLNETDNSTCDSGPPAGARLLYQLVQTWRVPTDGCGPGLQLAQI